MPRQMRVVGAALLAATLSGAARPSAPERLQGYFTVRWEEQSFRPCGGSERWWVSDPGPLLRRYRELVQGEYGTVYVTVQAEVSDPGRFGHLGMFPRTIAVREVIEARAPTGDDCHGRDVAVE
jgi:hypothetical protein